MAIHNLIEAKKWVTLFSLWLKKNLSDFLQLLPLIVIVLLGLYYLIYFAFFIYLLYNDSQYIYLEAKKDSQYTLYIYFLYNDSQYKLLLFF